MPCARPQPKQGGCQSAGRSPFWEKGRRAAIACWRPWSGVGRSQRQSPGMSLQSHVSDDGSSRQDGISPQIVRKKFANGRRLPTPLDDKAAGQAHFPPIFVTSRYPPESSPRPTGQLIHLTPPDLRKQVRRRVAAALLWTPFERRLSTVAYCGRWCPVGQDGNRRGDRAPGPRHLDNRTARHAADAAEESDGLVVVSRDRINGEGIGMRGEESRALAGDECVHSRWWCAAESSCSRRVAAGRGVTPDEESATP